MEKSPLDNAICSFTLDLFKTLGDKDKTSNVFFSPLSISAGLSMVLLGARGDSATQIAQCLKIKDIPDVHTRFAKLLQELTDNIHCQMSFATRLYGEKSFHFIKDFLEGTREHYNAELETVDFIANAEEARDNINTWVEEATQGRIRDLLAKDAVDSSTRLVLVNALYLKSKWALRFSEEDTYDADFRLNKHETKTVKMMTHGHKIQYPVRLIEEINCQVIELRYMWEHSMIIFLPNDIEDDSTGLEKLEQQLTYEKYMEWTKDLYQDRHLVTLGIPQFRVEGNYQLEEALVDMGMKDIFDEKCDFTGMSPDKDLQLSKVVHKTYVSVDEQGTEAAAAMFAGFICGSALPKPNEFIFIADHPFLFFIQRYDTILFAGRFCSPE